MPHLTLEYTANLKRFDPMSTLVALNNALAASGQFDEFDIKSRAISRDTFFIGTSDEPRGFVHVSLALLSGRSPQTKSELSAAMLRVVRMACRDVADFPLQASVEVVDLERASYSKDLVPAGLPDDIRRET